jgi:hypothetical protein
MQNDAFMEKELVKWNSIRAGPVMTRWAQAGIGFLEQRQAVLIAAGFGGMDHFLLASFAGERMENRYYIGHLLRHPFPGDLRVIVVSGKAREGGGAAVLVEELD